MALENVYKITANTKKKMFRELPEVIQNDNVVFEVDIIDDTTSFTLSANYSYKLVSLKQSGLSTIRDGVLSGQVIRFNLGTSEMTEPGKVEATVQVFDVDNKRISTAKFDFVVKKDPSLQGSLPADNTSLVIANESLLTDAINKSNQASTDSTTAITKATSAETKATNAETTANEVRDEFDQVVAEAGSNNPEVVQARGTYPLLKDRFTKVESDLADRAKQTDVNTALLLKADKTTTDNLQNQVSSLASGSPKAVSLTSQMTDQTKNYVYTGTESGYTAGHWYYYNGTAWADGGVYQSAGIGSKTVSIGSLTDEVRGFQYPFQEKATLSVSGKSESVVALRDGIFDIKLYGANPSKNYSISRIQRKNGASVVNAIDIWDSDTYGIVSSFYAANYTEATGIDTISLSAMNSSGITAKIMIDWSKFPNPTDYNSLIYTNCGISKKCYVSRVTDSEVNTSITTINDTLTKNQILMFIKDIRIYNAKSGHVYGINTIKRNSSNVWQIDIWDFTDSKYVCSFYKTGYTEPTGFDSITLATLNDSITATMNVQWSKIPTGNNTSVLPIYVKNPAEQTVNARRWEGKYWYADGDSITEQNNYPYFLNQYCKFAGYYNAGQSGKGMAYMTDKFAVEPLTNYDLITVFAGTNDYGGHTPLGTINDTKDTASFYGYVKKVIYTVLTAKPTIKLAFFTPVQRGAFSGQPTYPAPNNLGFTLDQYVDAIKEVCEMYAIPCLDLFRVSGVNEFTLTTMTTDNLHLNNGVGGQTVARTIQGFIEAL